MIHYYKYHFPKFCKISNCQLIIIHYFNFQIIGFDIFQYMNFVNLKLSTGLILLQKQIYRSHFYLRYLQLSHRALSSVTTITREFRQAARDSNNRDMTLSVEIMLLDTKLLQTPHGQHCKKYQTYTCDNH